MINDEELLFVVDGENNPLDPLPRSEVHKNLLWHRTTGVWIINRKNQILCQRRSLKKDIRPGYWSAFFGGHLGPSEEYIDNAIEEVKEELGIDVKEEDFIAYKVFKSDKPTHREFSMIYGLILSRDDNDFQFEKEEMDQVAWIKINEVRKILVDEKRSDWVLKPWDSDVLSWLITLV